MPSLERCDGIKDDTIIMVDNSQKTWKEIKSTQMSNWIISDTSSTDGFTS